MLRGRGLRAMPIAARLSAEAAAPTRATQSSTRGLVALPSLPFLPFYTADFLADERVSSMTLAERGLYITLLCHAWREGSIPNDVAAIARLVQRPKTEIAKAWPAVSQCFKIEGGRLVQKRMEVEREKAGAMVNRRREAGRKGAEGRWRPDGNANAVAMPERDAVALRFDGIHNHNHNHSTETTVPAVPPSPRSARNEAREPWAIPPLPAELPAAFPRHVDELVSIAEVFLAAFGNGRPAEAVEKHRPAYVDALATFRSRGASIADAWRAFVDARLAHEGRPLFSSQAKTALSYLERRERAGADERTGPYDRAPATIAPEDRR